MRTSPPVLPPPPEELLLLLPLSLLLPHAATPTPVSAVSAPTARTLPTLLIKSLSSDCGGKHIPARVRGGTLLLKPVLYARSRTHDESPFGAQIEHPVPRRVLG